ATYAAVRTDGIGAGLAGLVPRTRLTHVIFALEHERSRGADADAVSAINASGIRQGDIELRGDVGGEAPSGDSDRKGVLRIHAASFNAFVAENAFCVVSYVKIVINLRRLG